MARTTQRCSRRSFSLSSRACSADCAAADPAAAGGALGGFGSLRGSSLSGLLIGQMEALAGWLIDPSYKYVVIFSLYLVVVVLRPQGLFGRF